ncbi:putative splicing regulatory glutamine/lysine-rich protein 1-like [Apostichopus japonicus]|uniref:Putative splicing regulatory glutamine/lysine-rich protein 1-like n=1 Tax=Stichopus japonicus TaxID=307972 RepID=A0A2G8JYG2_STIJA|nr:putative splicing regulatory glutamine/lysine-rich protein 1-like [Apostichopus japonicus]
MVNTRVAQVSNVSAAATMEQLRTLFGFLGKIEDIRLFPKEDSVLPVTVRICFVRFQDPTSVGMAQHLSNTVFLDKALNVTPFPDGVIPEESRALQMVAASAGGLVSMISNAGTSLLPTPPQPLLGHLPGTISGVAVSTTSAGVMDQTFAALGVPQPPPLTNVDPTKVEEIRRTVYVGNLDSGTVTAEQLLSFFQKVGEVKYVRMAGDETQPTRFAFVEFTEQGSVAKALTYNSVMFAGRPLKINHSNNAIVKPPGKTQEAIQKELAETMKQVRDAQALIQAAIDPEIKAAADKNCTEGLVGDNEKKKRSKSRSPARRKSRSRSRRRSRSRSKDARRSRSRRSTHERGEGLGHRGGGRPHRGGSRDPDPDIAGRDQRVRNTARGPGKISVKHFVTHLIK